jgi:hypothetical protein
MDLNNQMSAPPNSLPFSPPMAFSPPTNELLVFDTPADEKFPYILDMVQMEEPVT